MHHQCAIKARCLGAHESVCVVVELAFLGGCCLAVGAVGLFDDDPSYGVVAYGGGALGVCVTAEFVGPGGGGVVGSALQGGAAQIVVFPCGGELVGAGELGDFAKSLLDQFGFCLVQRIGADDLGVLDVVVNVVVVDGHRGGARAVGAQQGNT